MSDVIKHEPRARRDVDLIDHVTRLWPHRWWILAVVVLAALVGAALAWRTPPTFEATAKLLATVPKVFFEGDPDGTATVSIPTFQELIQNRGLAATVVREFGLEKPPYSLTPTSFATDVLRVESIRDTYILKLSVTMSEPRLAADIVNRVAQLAVVLSETVSAKEATKAQDLIKVQLEESKRRVEAAASALVAFQGTAARETREKMDGGRRKRVLELTRDIEIERAQLARAEEELARRTPNRGIDAVHEQLGRDIARIQTRLSGLEGQRDALMGERTEDRAQAAGLTEMYRYQAELRRLGAELAQAQRLYDEVAARYESSRLQVTARSSQLQLLDPAPVPDRPVSSHLVRNVAAGAFLGLLASLVGALFLNALRF